MHTTSSQKLTWYPRTSARFLLTVLEVDMLTLEHTWYPRTSARFRFEMLEVDMRRMHAGNRGNAL